MKFTCYFELCTVYEDCECESKCCRGVKTKPMIITYISDQEIQTNNPHIEYEISEEDIHNLVYHHICPFCGNYTEC